MGESPEDPTAQGGRRPSRWISAEGSARQVVCVGDSTSRTVFGELTWVDHLAIGLGAPGESKPVEGFRGIWRTKEWTRQGVWRRTTRDDAFDAAPYGFGYVSSGAPSDGLTWTRPMGIPVAAFDLYTMAVPGLASPQFRVDDGAWRDVATAARPGSMLVRTRVAEHVQERVQLRAGEGTAPAPVAVAGLDIHGSDPDGSPRTRLHHLGIGKPQLAGFCRRSEGQPLALLDALRPELVIVAVTNDVLWCSPASWEATLRDLVGRVEAYADVLLMSMFEQRAPRTVGDAVTRSGSDRVRSATAEFVASDLTVAVLGTGIPADPETTIVAVESAGEAVLSAAATSTGEGRELVIGQGREVDMQAAYRATTRRVAAMVGCRHLDICEAWRDVGVAGWEDAKSRGLMLDRNHTTPEGHRDIAARVLEVLARHPDPPDPTAGSTGTGTGSRRDPGSLPVITPGRGVIAAPTSGQVELHVPVSLSSPSEQPVAVRWRTRLVEDTSLVQAPRSDYIGASGRVTFGAGEVEVTVTITVTGNSTGVDQTVVVEFSDPIGATVGGVWGLGFGVITPAPGVG